MAYEESRRTVSTAVVVLGFLLCLVASTAILKAVVKADEVDSAGSATTTQTSTNPHTDAPSTNTGAADTDSATTTQAAPSVAVDPGAVATLKISSMAIVIPYLKNVGTVTFNVLRSTSGTRYVQLSAPALASLKCGSKGVFATILKNPTNSEAGALSQKMTVDGSVYGLSLAKASCENNSDLLAKYQGAFSEPFTLLKKM